MANSWPLGLVKTLNDTKNHIISSNLAVVIHDKFPKAKHHFLVLPKQNISTIFNLRSDQLPLLEELYLLALNIIEIKQEELHNFKIGFHAQPSMQQLHLHVISKDFISESFKTKKHWNSFNTRLFLPYEAAYEELKVNGCIKRLTQNEIQSLAAMALECNQCEFTAKNVPELKNHLWSHWIDKQKNV